MRNIYCRIAAPPVVYYGICLLALSLSISFYLIRSKPLPSLERPMLQPYDTRSQKPALIRSEPESLTYEEPPTIDKKFIDAAGVVQYVNIDEPNKATRLKEQPVMQSTEQMQRLVQKQVGYSTGNVNRPVR